MVNLEIHHSPVSSLPKIGDAQKEIDYAHFDDRFENRPVKIAPAFGDLEVAREEYIKESALSYVKPLNFPQEFGGLETLKFKKTPATRLWYRRVSSFERNGFFNMWTMKLNLKLRIWLFYPVILWGVTNHIFQGMYFEEFDFTGEPDLKVYDKLNARPIPFARVWSRPG